MDKQTGPVESDAFETDFAEADATNFIDLILCATEFSEDEGAVRDLVDVFFEAHRDQLTDLREARQSGL